MALYRRAGTYYVKLSSPDGSLIRRSARTQDRRKAQEYHDRLKAQLWDLAYLKKKPKRTWDEAALRWLKEKAHKKSYRDDESRIRWFTQHLRGKTLNQISRDSIDQLILEETGPAFGPDQGSLCRAHPRHLPQGDAQMGVDRDHARLQDVREGGAGEGQVSDP